MGKRASGRASGRAKGSRSIKKKRALLIAPPKSQVLNSLPACSGAATAAGL